MMKSSLGIMRCCWFYGVGVFDIDCGSYVEYLYPSNVVVNSFVFSIYGNVDTGYRAVALCRRS
jgi:hypothetical protein